MPKEYFSHDYNARNDRKIAALVKDYKSAGYGIFWCTCEMMHEDGGSLEFDDLTFGAIAKDLNEDENFIKEVVEKCISKYRLFHKNEAPLEANEAESKQTKITSNRVKQNLVARNTKKKAKIEAGRLGGIKSGESRRSKQTEAPLEATNQRKGKEKKGKEIKEEREKGIFPDQNFEIELPEHEIGKAVEYIANTKNAKSDKKMILSMWENFKIKKFTGKKFYKDNRDIISHFFETLKFEQLNGTGTHKQISGSTDKLGTSDARIDKASKW